MNEQILIPEAVRAAFLHVLKYCPTINLVSFDAHGRWMYVDSDNRAPALDEPSIDLDLLDQASDALQFLPALFTREQILL